jgi:hypothetical protein
MLAWLLFGEWIPAPSGGGAARIRTRLVHHYAA